MPQSDLPPLPPIGPSALSTLHLWVQTCQDNYANADVVLRAIVQRACHLEDPFLRVTDTVRNKTWLLHLVNVMLLQECGALIPDRADLSPAVCLWRVAEDANDRLHAAIEAAAEARLQRELARAHTAIWNIAQENCNTPVTA